MAHLLREQLERIAPLLSNPEYALMHAEGTLDPDTFQDPQLIMRKQEEMHYGMLGSDVLEETQFEEQVDPKLVESYRRTARRMLKDQKTIGLVYEQLARMGCDEDMASQIVLSVIEHNGENK